MLFNLYEAAIYPVLHPLQTALSVGNEFHWKRCDRTVERTASVRHSLCIIEHCDIVAFVFFLTRRVSAKSFDGNRNTTPHYFFSSMFGSEHTAYFFARNIVGN